MKIYMTVLAVASLFSFYLMLGIGRAVCISLMQMLPGPRQFSALSVKNWVFSKMRLP